MSKRNIVHIEIPASNAKESAAFYNQLFGWKMEVVEEMDYTMWEPEVEPGGGFSPLGEGVKPGDVLIFVDSADIEADLQRVKELGGTVVTPKMEIPGVGWFGIFKDPVGNKIALYTSKNP
jgi:uncharacterized protein